jgi:hypothetical protein
VLRLGPGDMSGHLLTAAGSRDDPAARDVCAGLAHADVLVDVYFNSGAAYNVGCVTAYDPARLFAGLMQSAVLAAMNAQGWQIPDGGVLPDQGLSARARGSGHGHLSRLGPAERPLQHAGPMPGALIEPLFVTDPFEGSVAASNRGQPVIAAGLARAIERYFAQRRAGRSTERTDQDPRGSSGKQSCSGRVMPAGATPSWGASGAVVKSGPARPQSRSRPAGSGGGQYSVLVEDLHGGHVVDMRVRTVSRSPVSCSRTAERSPRDPRPLDHDHGHDLQTRPHAGRTGTAAGSQDTQNL